MPEGEYHTFYTFSTNSTFINIACGTFQTSLPLPLFLFMFLSCCVCVFQAIESVNHIAHMWSSADENLRNTVKETVLSFGTNSKYFDLILLYYILFL